MIFNIDLEQEWCVFDRGRLMALPNWRWMVKDVLNRTVDCALLYDPLYNLFTKDQLAQAEVNLHLTTDKTVQKYNAKYRGKDKPTNVLSFSYQEGDNPPPASTKNPWPLGDVFVAVETACREIEGEDKNIVEHTYHLVCHGLLHVMGYDHETDDDAEKMEYLEIRTLESLGISNPYKAKTAPVITW